MGHIVDATRVKPTQGWVAVSDARAPRQPCREYIDRAVTETTTVREEFNRVIAACEAGPTDTLTAPAGQRAEFAHDLSPAVGQSDGQDPLLGREAAVGRYADDSSLPAPEPAASQQ